MPLPRAVTARAIRQTHQTRPPQSPLLQDLYQPPPQVWTVEETDQAAHQVQVNQGRVVYMGHQTVMSLEYHRYNGMPWSSASQGSSLALSFPCCSPHTLPVHG